MPTNDEVLALAEKVRQARRKSDRAAAETTVLSLHGETAAEHLRNGLCILRSWVFLPDEERAGPEGLGFIEAAEKRIRQALTQIEQETR